MSKTNSKEYNQQYYQKNKDRLKLKHRLYREKNLSLYRAMTRASQKKNPACSAAHSAKRRAIKSMCTPKWLTPTHIEQINMFYECSAFYSNLTGTKFQVDHIIPMQGKEVCGLHVPWNLQVITREENISERNFLDLNK